MRKIKYLLLLFPAILGGCMFLPVTDSTRFYIMGVRSEPELDKQNCPISIGLGKISIPYYLDKPQMVMLISNNEINQDEFNRWGEPVDECIVRILCNTINQNCSNVKMIIYPFDKYIPIDYKIRIKIHDLLPNEIKKAVILSSSWSVTDKDHNVIIKNDSQIFISYDKDDQCDQDDKKTNKYIDVVFGIENAIKKLASEISEAINTTIPGQRS
jgi:uncharacterized lipoprotein YmbA